jgi:choline dehydrogenase-like flavoprotein
MSSESLGVVGPRDPHAGVRRFADYTGPVRERCQVLVVGSGPGGAVVAKELAERGKDVILVEEGPPISAKEFRQETAASMRQTLRESGMRVAQGNAFFPTMQAIALGGGSLINSAICCRVPHWVLDKWAAQHSLTDLHAGSLDEHFDDIERFLGIEYTQIDVQGERNLLFKKGCDALGYSSEPTPRNASGCKGSGECFTGCRTGAKKSTDVSYVPAAIDHGARVLSSVRVETLTGTTRKVTGIRGHVVEPFTGRASHEVQIDADVVVLAAGCMATPCIMIRSEIGLSSGHVGKNLQGHPGLAVLGIYPHKVDPWQGATQGYQSLHFLKEGLKLEVLWAPPAILAVRFPGLGHDFKEQLMEYDRMAPFDVIVAADNSSGSVRPRSTSWDPDIRFNVHQSDMNQLKRGLITLCDISWAAGAERILPGVHGVPDVLYSPEETRFVRDHDMKVTDPTFGMNHVFGTTRMGVNPRTSVVDTYGKVHDVDNLYVADTSVFPGSPAINPMLTCMALARRTAVRIAG